MGQLSNALCLDRDSIIQPLRAGVVPLKGLEYFQVGREQEINAVLKDLKRIESGGASFRFISGEPGSGKTFLLNSMHSRALSHGLVVVSARLSANKCFVGAQGQAQSLYTSLMQSMATPARPMGEAMANVVERFVVNTVREANELGILPDIHIANRLACFEELAAGFDFIHIVQRYWEALDDGNSQLEANVLRWFKAQYSDRGQAREELGVCAIIDESNSIDCLKMMAHFVRLAGYKGLVVTFDELASLCQIDSELDRAHNFDQLQAIINSCWMGATPGLGFFCFSTPELIEDEERGIGSHAVLRGCLAQNRFSHTGLPDWTSPVIALTRLTEHQIQQVLENLWLVYSESQSLPFIITDEDLQLFSHSAQDLLGEEYFCNPGATIKTFLDFLAVRECHPTITHNHIFAAIDSGAAPLQ